MNDATNTTTTTATTAWTPERIVALLQGNPKAVRRAILALDARQTAAEAATHTTTDANGRGWSMRDAQFGGWLAAEIRAGRPFRTEKIQACALRLACRYRRQLCEEANRREANGTAEVGRVMASARAIGADVPATKAEALAYGAAILASLRAEEAPESAQEPADDGEPDEVETYLRRSGRME